jgi:tannase/feruloyl esterase
MDPAMETEYSRISGMWSQTVFNRAAPKDASGKPQLSQLYSASDRKLVLTHLLDACDGLDGMKDGLIFNYAACHFDPATLICKGKKTDACLTKNQAEALKSAIAGPKTRGGIQVYPPYPYDTGLIEGRFMLGAPVIPAASGAPMPPTNTATEMDVDQAAASAAADGAARLINTANWTNYSTFFGHGGKIIFIHGLSDPVFSALDSVGYYQRLVKDNGGPDAVRAESRLFLIPGMLHCQGGTPTVDHYDSLDAIVKWVEQGSAPEKIVGSISNMPDSSRPLCAWPAYAHYNGSGDPKDAANYECRE